MQTHTRTAPLAGGLPAASRHRPASIGLRRSAQRVADIPAPEGGADGTEPAPARTGTSPAPRPRSRAVLGGALACLAAGCLLAGAAGCIALGAPSPLGLAHTAVAIGSAAGALGLVGIGAILALRARGLRAVEERRRLRSARIRRELGRFELTPREAEVAELILDHCCYQDIACALGLSPRTVQFHASNIFHKASVARRHDFERLVLAEEEPRDADGAPYEHIRRIRREGKGGEGVS